MPFTIGLRFYRVVVRQKRSRDLLPIGPGNDPCDLFDFFNGFVLSRAETTTESGDQRSWFLEKKANNNRRTIDGVVNYGTHGFESNIKDVKTRAKRFVRKASDLEEIPLYFQFYSPEEEHYALLAFQSFQGRSCISHVRRAMREEFDQLYPEYMLSISVLAPSRSMMDGAPVKNVTFIRSEVHGDRADRYALGTSHEAISYELTIRAKKRGSMISTFKELRERFQDDEGAGIVEFDDQQFDSIKADINFGGRKRTVGVYGAGYDTGLIDVTKDIERGENGHPTLASIRNQTDELMEALIEGLSG